MPDLFVIEEKGLTRSLPAERFTKLDLGFQMLNPLQTRFCIEGLHRKDCNIICTWPTGAGKTVCAELIAERALSEGKKVVYACPLKSLAEEKAERMRKLFPERRVEIFTGDYTDVEKRAEKAQHADIAVVTCELLDSVSRKRMLSEVLLKRAGVLVSDEAHIIATERGPALEGALVRIASLNRNIRHVLLSATVPNAEDLALWIRDLTEKDTFVLKGSWMPVRIRWHVLDVRPRKPRKEWRKAAADRVLVLLRMLLSSDPDSRILLFVWTKGEGRLLEKRIAEAGIPCAFHNGELDLSERLSLEHAFEDGTIRVLVSTTTLAWGRNTSARHVVLFGEKRGIEYVDGWDILQAGGRAGRVGKAEKGDVWWIVSDVEFADETLRNPPEIVSRLSDPSALAFQILGELPFHGKRKVSDLRSWYEKTFASRCAEKTSESDDILTDAVDILVACDCAFEDSAAICLTDAGRIAKTFYVRPEEIHLFLQVLRLILEIPPEDPDLDLFCILFTAHSASATRKFFLSYDERAFLQSVHAERWIRKYRDFFLGEIHKFCAYSLFLWHMLHSENPDERPHYKVREFIWDMERIAAVCHELSERIFRAPEGFLSSIKKAGLCLRYGAPLDVSELLEIPGIGAKRALELKKLGIRTTDELLSALSGKMKEKVEKILPESVIRDLLSESSFIEYSFPL